MLKGVYAHIVSMSIPLGNMLPSCVIRRHSADDAQCTLN